MLVGLLAGHRASGPPQAGTAATAVVSEHGDPALITQLDALQHKAFGNGLGNDLSYCTLT